MIVPKFVFVNQFFKVMTRPGEMGIILFNFDRIEASVAKVKGQYLAIVRVITQLSNAKFLLIFKQLFPYEPLVDNVPWGKVNQTLLMPEAIINVVFFFLDLRHILGHEDPGD